MTGEGEAQNRVGLYLDLFGYKIIGLGVSSRWLSAYDALRARKIELSDLPGQAMLARAAADRDAEASIIAAATKAFVARIETDSDLANSVLENRFKKDLASAVNHTAVLGEAAEQIASGGDGSANAPGPDVPLSEQFLNRFGTYSAEASTDELRQRWGRVLAAEVRKPGTFSLKLLRIVDEIDASTATLFERICAARLKDGVLKSLTGALSFSETKALVEASLIVEPGLVGHELKWDAEGSYRGEPAWALFGDTRALAIPKSFAMPQNTTWQGPPPLTFNDGRVSSPAYVLTEPGRALATILPDNEASMFGELQVQLRAYLGIPEVHIAHKGDDGDFHVQESS